MLLIKLQLAGGVGDVPPKVILLRVKDIKLYIPERMFFSSRLYEYILTLNSCRVNHSGALLGFEFFTFSEGKLHLLINK